jgi:thiamine-phosphate pyrophosphorylase
MAEAVMAGGCRWLQYRNKSADPATRRVQAQMLAEQCRAYGARLIVNDDPFLAREVGAAGAHLGRDDGDPQAARTLLGANAILGVTCYQDIARAKAMRRQGADYLAFGAIYPSPSKPHALPVSLALLRRACKNLDTPICAIGGITLENAAPLCRAGIGFLAVCHDLFARPPEKIASRAAAYQALFQEFFHDQQR